MRNVKKLIWLVSLIIIVNTNSWAQEVIMSTGVNTADEVARELANPNTALGSMSFNFDYQHFNGSLPNANNQWGLTMGFQPSMPYSIKEGVNLFFRPQIPIIFRKSVYDEDKGTFDTKGINLGDISADLAIGKTFTKSGIIVVGGVFTVMPTATSNLGGNKWLLGPEFLLGWIQKWGAIGALITQANRVGGSDGKVNLLSGQYFYVVNIKNGWQISGTPTYSVNLKGTKGNKVSMPLASGFNKTVIAGKVPIKLGVQYWYYVATPDVYGPQHQIRFAFSPVSKLPW